MNDRELLELAAKAAGIYDLQWESDGTVQNRINRPTIPYECHGMITAIDWNPLFNDGDALRLAVKLNMQIHPDAVYVKCGWSHGTPDYAHANYENYADDPYAATRRAIVRAAAAIGKEVP